MGRRACRGGSTWTSTGGNLYFEETASADSALISVNGGQGSGAINGATLTFLGSSTAGSGSIFLYEGSADDAQAGRLFFYEDSSGGTARVELFGGGVDFSLHNPGTVTVGSIEFDDAVYLGSINLEVGGNNFADLFQGSMRDGSAGGGAGASLTKVGTNALVSRARITKPAGPRSTAARLTCKPGKVLPPHRVRCR